MRNGRTGGRIERVTATARIELELDRSEPIGGLLRDSRGAEHEFHGWLGLIACLEEAWEAQWDRAEQGRGTGVEADR